MESGPDTSIAFFRPGDFLVREKTECEALYFIKDGEAEVYKTGESGEIIPVGIVLPGQYVGETALLMGTQYKSNVVALTDVTALKYSRAAMEVQMKVAPAWLLDLTKGLIQRLHKANELIRSNGWIDQALAMRMGTPEEEKK